jgi:hypothetical protein
MAIACADRNLEHGAAERTGGSSFRCVPQDDADARNFRADQGKEGTAERRS